MSQPGSNGQGSIDAPVPPPYNYQQPPSAPQPAEEVDRRPMHDFHVRAPSLIWADEYFRIQARLFNSEDFRLGRSLMKS